MEETLLIIKPDAIKYSRKIIERIINEGFDIVQIRRLRLSKADAEEFYKVHRGKNFYKKLVEFMSSGEIIVLRVRRENAINYLRKIIGNTSPKKAENGTIRKMFGTSTCKNAVHASDGKESAKFEINFFFNE